MPISNRGRVRLKAEGLSTIVFVKMTKGLGVTMPGIKIALLSVMKKEVLNSGN